MSAKNAIARYHQLLNALLDRKVKQCRYRMTHTEQLMDADDYNTAKRERHFTAIEAYFNAVQDYNKYYIV